MNIDNLTDEELLNASEWIMEKRRKDDGKDGAITLRSAFVAAQFLKDELEKRTRQ